MNEERDELQTAPDDAGRRRGDDLLARILDEGRLARDESGAANARQMLSELVEQIVDGRLVASDNTASAINSRIEEIDRLVSAQLNEVMHAEEFRKLEASWRGLAYLTFNTETGPDLKLRVMNVSKAELSEDFENAQGVEQSVLFRRVYEQVFGVFGEVPYGALVGDYEFSNRPKDLALLKELAAVAAAAHAPFIAAASPELFGWSSFKEMQNTRDIAKILDSAEYAEWRSLRESEDSKYVGLCLPHTLMRLPYGREVQAVTFHFREEVDGQSSDNYLWGNAAYSFATRLTDAFAKYHWCAAIRGYEGGGQVEGLPAYFFSDEEGNLQVRSVTEVSITDRREKELSDNGFIPLVGVKNTDYAIFLSANSCHKPKWYDSFPANDTSRLTARLPYIFTTSRFAHYIKLMVRDKVGSFMEREEVEQFLNHWINQYVLADDDASAQLKAQYPLRKAEVQVSDVEGKPGAYKAIVYLLPQFQLDEPAVSLRLVVDLPALAK